MATVDSPKRRTVFIKTGGTTRSVWLNGERVYQPSQELLTWHTREEVEVTLEEGPNKIVAEVGPVFFLSLAEEKD